MVKLEGLEWRTRMCVGVCSILESVFCAVVEYVLKGLFWMFSLCWKSSRVRRRKHRMHADNGVFYCGRWMSVAYEGGSPGNMRRPSLSVRL